MALERQPVEEEWSVAAVQETSTLIPSEDYHSHLNTEGHTEKINKYQAMLASRLKVKYFSTNTCEIGDMFEEIVIQSETIQLSRWPFLQGYLQIQQKFTKKRTVLRRTSLHLWLVKPCPKK